MAFDGGPITSASLVGIPNDTASNLVQSDLIFAVAGNGLAKTSRSTK